MSHHAVRSASAATIDAEPTEPTPQAVPDRLPVGIEDEPSRLRQRAEALLAALSKAKEEARRQSVAFNRADAMEAVAGRSAIDAAIERTRQSIRAFDEALLTRTNALPRNAGGTA